MCDCFVDVLEGCDTQIHFVPHLRQHLVNYISNLNLCFTSWGLEYHIKKTLPLPWDLTDLNSLHLTALLASKPDSTRTINDGLCLSS